ncbi:hypothetical protein Pint_06122 [Pistacia integerrima]|uniref:Uncharacterized protein n=1 Tax=Pistacia integerrima TaxID=434235 RepID=A0ACC0ZAB1_9ROSI|nr:hypothetical protein Pint_06122 [Pistacia integerrima]
MKIGLQNFFSVRASDKCQKEKRKTINGDDLLWAMATLGFEDYIEPLKAYLVRYREDSVKSILTLFGKFELRQGDTKGAARGGDGSAKRDTVGTLAGQNAQFGLQGSLNYANPQVNPQLMALTAVHREPRLVIKESQEIYRIFLILLSFYLLSSFLSAAIDIAITFSLRWVPSLNPSELTRDSNYLGQLPCSLVMSEVGAKTPYSLPG